MPGQGNRNEFGIINKGRLALRRRPLFMITISIDSLHSDEQSLAFPYWF